MKKWKSREVRVAALSFGADHPVRIQSMTTSDTRDVSATVAQVIRLADAGCEMVRMTVQGMKEAEACEEIKNELVKKGYLLPLVADIHFYPPAAMRVADSVDKVRINPGNFVDKRASFKVLEYSDADYQEEIVKIEEKFTPLVEKCKRLKRAMRIGTNHGSLSDRIMNRYGDSPSGMVESALEFARIARKLDYHDFFFSMKASNTHVMTEAYRLLVAQMMELGWDYPLHLGVTEAGEGEDGRVKSAIGIGSLLLDGIGDTIRVSLTEDPWCEVDPCKRLVKMGEQFARSGFIYQKREAKRSVILPSYFHPQASVLLEVHSHDQLVGAGYSKQLGRYHKEKGAVDGILATSSEVAREGLPLVQNYVTLTEDESKWDELLSQNPELILFAPTKERISFGRKLGKIVREKKNKTALILDFSYDLPEEDLVIYASAEMGTLLCEGIGEGILLRAHLPSEKLVSLSFAILQASRLRSVKTEFISCPGCGRTLFDLQKVSARIREETAHLPGVKIAIMGCIVNGPGEMADADFGYVGSRPGMIDLYVGKERVEKNIVMDEAPSRLVALIKHHGRWVEKH